MAETAGLNEPLCFRPKTNTGGLEEYEIEMKMKNGKMPNDESKEILERTTAGHLLLLF